MKNNFSKILKLFIIMFLFVFLVRMDVYQFSDNKVFNTDKKNYKNIVSPTLMSLGNDSVTFDSSLSVDKENKLIKNINPYAIIDNIKNNILTSGVITVLDKNNKEILDGSSIAKTGDIFKITLADQILEYTVSIKGDVTGTGMSEMGDAMKIAKHIIDNNVLDSVVFEDAADVNNDGKIAMNDVMKIAKNVIEVDNVVMFNSNGGSLVNSQFISGEQKMVKPDNPRREGFEFLGWYDSFGQLYDFSSEVDNNINLYALWSPIIEYNSVDEGKWIFINNPEALDKNEYLADNDYESTSIYKDFFNGDVEIYYEHGIDTNIVKYYAIELYNPNDTAVTLKVNKCGAETGWSAAGIVDYYYNDKCSSKGSYIIQPGKVSYIFHNDNSQIVGDKSVISSVSKINSGAIEGIISLNSSDTLYISAIAFKDINNVSDTYYDGNFTDLSAGGQHHALVFSGYYNKLPILTADITIPIYDQTSDGDFPVSFTNNAKEKVIENRWETNLNGGYIWKNQPYYMSDVFVQDFVHLNVPTKYNSSTNTVLNYIELGPYNDYMETRDSLNKDGVSVKGWNYNWANWAVHYREKVKIINNSSNSKVVKFNLFYESAGDRIAVYYNDNSTLVGKDKDYTVWQVTVPAKSTKVLESEITLMGHSGGKIEKFFNIS